MRPFWRSLLNTVNVDSSRANHCLPLIFPFWRLANELARLLRSSKTSNKWLQKRTRENLEFLVHARSVKAENLVHTSFYWAFVDKGDCSVNPSLWTLMCCRKFTTILSWSKLMASTVEATVSPKWDLLGPILPSRVAFMLQSTNVKSHGAD